MKLAYTQQMRDLEAAAVAAGQTWAGLMEQAGTGVAQEILAQLDDAHARRALILVGPGNNGGDALVVARHLAQAGLQLQLYLWRRIYRDDDLNWQLCRQLGLPETFAADDPEQDTLVHLLQSADYVVDGLLGMGTQRPVADLLAAIVQTVNRVRAARPDLQIVSIDLPTGIQSDSGAVLDHAIRADLTVATGLAKRGLLCQPGRSYAGRIALAPIQLVAEHVEAIMSETIDSALASRLLPARPADSHKGTYGKAMVVAGSILYPGAAILASAAAARVGAGIVTLASGRSVLLTPGRIPEVTLRPLPESDGVLNEAAADEVLKHLDGYRALLVGPGLGSEPPTREFIKRLLAIEPPRHRSGIGFRLASGQEQPLSTDTRPDLPPTVLDADALNHLSNLDAWWEHVPAGRCVLTPHPGEMKRLLALESFDDPVKLASEAAERWQQIVVLKGATTIIADPSGRTVLHDAANPALATAGTGDVLAGAIVGLLAQGVAPFDAAALGVYLHSAAGRLVRDEFGDAGALASDLLPRLPLAIKAFREQA
jgi:hydroxyethylthiazole kinase-like uncharacterized protein yjeF